MSKWIKKKLWLPVINLWRELFCLMKKKKYIYVCVYRNGFEIPWSKKKKCIHTKYRRRKVFKKLYTKNCDIDIDIDIQFHLDLLHARMRSIFFHLLSISTNFLIAFLLWTQNVIRKRLEKRRRERKREKKNEKPR